MSFIQGRDFTLQVGRGLISGVTGVSKFGLAPTGIQTTITDIWSRADATPTQQIWLAPTAAAIHNVKSSSADDDGGPVGDGARTVKIYGLKTWASAETSETVTLNGTTDVETAESYVIIHRMKVVTSGATSINVGTITATAKAPSATTVTAVIIAGEGQTEMAIYGVPSVQTLFLTRWTASIAQTKAQTSAFRISVNTNPDVQTTNFVRKEDMSLQSDGSSMFEKHYKYYPSFSGPCIVKVQAIASAAALDAHSGFDGFLVTT